MIPSNALVLSTILFAASLTGCSSSKNSEAASPPAGYTIATVRDMSGLDGCGFLLVADDSTRYEPMNLDSQFRKDGVRVFFTYKPVDGMSICMSGKMISLTDIKIAKP